MIAPLAALLLKRGKHACMSLASRIARRRWRIEMEDQETLVTLTADIVPRM
jgi:hypothetical protein